jgi:hypothetical protein
MDPFTVIANLIHQAEQLAGDLVGLASKEESQALYSPESIDNVDSAITQAMKLTIRIHNLIEKLYVKQGATRVISLLKDQKVDYTLLLYLQLPESLKKSSELLSYLDSICADMKIDTSSSYFYKCIWNHFESEGVSQVTPDKYITSSKKSMAIEDYDKVKKSWGSHNPLFIQTYSTRDGKFTDHLYHITRTVQDGIIRLLDILKSGVFMVNGKAYDACGAFEHVISPSTLTCQIYDCEIMSTALGDMKSLEEIKEMMLCFPQCICKTMIEKDLISIEDIVTFVVKDRTRQVGEDKYKVSNHFIGNICAPKWIHRLATDICLAQWKERIDEADLAIKNTGLLPASFITNGINDSMITLDYSAIKSNGFTTAFSRKTPRDPFPRMVFADEICAGEVYERHECLKDPHDLHSSNLTDDQRRMLIYTQLFTAPKHEMLCYTEDAMLSMMDTAAASEDTKKVYFWILIILNSLKCLVKMPP